MTETAHDQLEASFYVQSPRTGDIFPVTAQGRSDLVARGYRDITEDGGAEKFAEQNKAVEPEKPAEHEKPAEPEKPAEQTPRQAQSRRAGTDATPGTPSQNTEDAARS